LTHFSFTLTQFSFTLTHFSFTIGTNRLWQRHNAQLVRQTKITSRCTFNLASHLTDILSRQALIENKKSHIQQSTKYQEIVVGSITVVAHATSQ